MLSIYAELTKIQMVYNVLMRFLLHLICYFSHQHNHKQYSSTVGYDITKRARIEKSV